MELLLIFISALFLFLPLSRPFLFFLSWFALIPLFYVLDTKSNKAGFFAGWLLGFFLMGLSGYWLYYPVKDFTGIPSPVVFLMLIILFILLGLFYAAWGYLYKKISSGQNLRPFLVAISWVGIEYLRFRILTFYPFAFTGYTQTQFRPLIQFAEAGGVFLISFIVILINAYFYRLFFYKHRKSLLALIIIFVCIITAGSYRYLRFENIDYQTKDIGIVQTMVPQEDKWAPENVKNNLNYLVEQSGKLLDNNLVITPETSLTFDLKYNNYYSNIFFEKIKNYDTYLQMGSQSARENFSGKYNSSFLVSPQGKIIQRYDKNKLVPFGEYVPFSYYVNRIPGINQGSLLSASEVTLFETDFASWKTFICSEILNPVFVRHYSPQAEFIITQSNEAWFGVSNLQKQMWIATIFRAVENRRAIAKSGNYAINGIIRPSGMVEIKTEVENRGVIRGLISLNDTKTFYQRKGDFVGYASLFLLLVLLFLKSFKRKTPDSEVEE